jgi:hypothetical protein
MLGIDLGIGVDLGIPLIAFLLLLKYIQTEFKPDGPDLKEVFLSETEQLRA